MPLVVADGPFVAESSFDELLESRGKDAGLPTVGTGSVEPLLQLMEADGPSSAGFSSKELPMTPGKAGDPCTAGSCSGESSIPPVKAGGPSSDGISSDVHSVSSGKSIKVLSWSSTERFLSDFFLSLSRAGLVGLRDNIGAEGGWDSCVISKPSAALAIVQPSSVESPTKALCAVSEVGDLVEDELNNSDMGLGGEDSLSTPLLSFTPFGFPLAAELNWSNEAVESVNTLDISRWVKNRLPGFSKLVGLPLCRHENLCIALLQKIERETEAAKELNRKISTTRKVVIFKEKGKRELRNLQSSVNYDGRQRAGC